MSHHDISHQNYANYGDVYIAVLLKYVKKVEDTNPLINRNNFTKIYNSVDYYIFKNKSNAKLQQNNVKSVLYTF